MRRLMLLSGAAALLLAALVVPGPLPAQARAATPEHTLAVSGTGVAMYPDFGPEVERFGVTTTGETAGSVTVTATTSDPNGSIRIDGRPAPDGTETLTGLTAGDEVSVFISDTSGVERHTLVYLPVGFPALDVTVDGPGQAPGQVFLTLTQWGLDTPKFETVVDHHGVPSYVRAAAAMDFKMLPNGHFTSSRQTTTAGRTGQALVEMDASFHELRTQETVAGLTDTDGHDSITLPDGDRYLLAYDHEPGTSWTDSVIQEVDADGHELWRWDSGDFGPDHQSLRGESVNSQDFGVFPGDYAHVNSLWLMQDGNLLVSFRHLSAVMKIATHDNDGFRSGEVMWKLGGRDSSFAFAAGEGGPCAQHAATELPNGHILVYDNGSDGTFAPKMCIDPADRAGPTVARPYTRVTEWALTPPSDGQPGRAEAVWDHDTTYGFFAGNAQRLANGNTMIGWAASPEVLAEEVTPAQDVVWKLVPTVVDGRPYTTYRAFKFDVPDAIDPVVDVRGPADGSTVDLGQHVAADFSCTDRGGSSLASCGGTRQPGKPLDTSTPGAHTWRAVATDGAGNTSTVTRSYTVAGPVLPDALIRPRPTGGWVGGDVYGSAREQAISQAVSRSAPRATSLVRLENDGTRADSLLVRGTAGNRDFKVSYHLGTTDITGRVVAGTWRSPRLAPRDHVTLRVVVTRLAHASRGDARRVTVAATSHHDPARADRVASVVTSGS